MRVVVSFHILKDLKALLTDWSLGILEFVRNSLTSLVNLRANAKILQS